MGTRATRLILCATLVVFTGGLSAGLSAMKGPADGSFRYRAAFWNSLHHFLYVLGRAEQGLPDAQRAAVVQAPRDTEGFDRLAPEDQAAWREAVAFYRQDLSQRDSVFNRHLIRTTLALVDAGDDPILGGPHDPELAATLTRVSQLYRRVWWQRHRSLVEARIREWNGLLERHGAPLIRRLSEIYQLDWPADGMTIEVVPYSNWAGAYSTGTDGRSLIVMSGLYDANRGVGGLESSLHESLHQKNAVSDRVLQLSRQHNVKPHDWLTHGLIFYTAGAVIQEEFPEHRPFSETSGIWDRVDPQLPVAFDRYWRPYLEGASTLDEALLELLRALRQR